MLTLAPQSGAIAQRELPPIFLLRLPCANAGGGNWGRWSESISVGRAFYRSKLFMGPGNRSAALTCRLQPNPPGVSFQRLQLNFGMRDTDRNSPAATVNVYLDGQRALSRRVSPGQPESLSQEFSPNISNVAVEVICESKSQYCNRVYFWDAFLEIAPSSLPQQ